MRKFNILTKADCENKTKIRIYLKPGYLALRLKKKIRNDLKKKH